MKAARVALYALTALVTGLLHLYLSLAGLVHNTLGLLTLSSLFGSSMLMGAGVVVWFRPRIAAKVGLTGSILLWVVYASLIDVYLAIDYRLEIRLGGYASLVDRLVGPSLLFVCTASSAFLLVRGRSARGRASTA